MNRSQALETSGIGLGYKNSARAMIQNVFYSGFVNRVPDVNGKTVYTCLKEKEVKSEKSRTARRSV